VSKAVIMSPHNPTVPAWRPCLRCTSAACKE
jgi:hypothetical protein